jgi:hypothetical protein
VFPNGDYFLLGNPYSAGPLDIGDRNITHDLSSHITDGTVSVA